MGATDERGAMGKNQDRREGTSDATAPAEPSSEERDDLDELFDELGRMNPLWKSVELRRLVESKPDKLSVYSLGLGGDELWDILEKEGIYSQKDLAAYLGVAESTLSGWLKEDRMPQMALLACLLLEMKQLAREEIIRLENHLRRPHVIREESRFHIVVLDEHPGEWTYGRFLMKDLDNENEALRYARSFEMEELLSDCMDVIEDMLGRTENKIYKDYLLGLKYNIENVLLSLRNVKKWKGSFRYRKDVEMIFDKIYKNFGDEGRKAR